MRLSSRPEPGVRPPVPAPSGETSQAALSHADLLDLIAAVSRGNRKAFVTLYEQSAGLVRADLTSQLPDQRQAAGVLAHTYVEVWWLAGCYAGTGAEVVPWIRQIAGRRAVEARTRRSRRASAAVPSAPTTAELELRALLRDQR